MRSRARNPWGTFLEGLFSTTTAPRVLGTYAQLWLHCAQLTLLLLVGLPPNVSYGPYGKEWFRFRLNKYLSLPVMNVKKRFTLATTFMGTNLQYDDPQFVVNFLLKVYKHVTEARSSLSQPPTFIKALCFVQQNGEDTQKFPASKEVLDLLKILKALVETISDKDNQDQLPHSINTTHFLQGKTVLIRVLLPQSLGLLPPPPPPQQP